MANIKNWTFRGHNWIFVSRPPGKMGFFITETFTKVILFTDEEYKNMPEKSGFHVGKDKVRRLKETDRELVELKFGKDSSKVPA